MTAQKTGAVMVVGGGVAGIQASLDLAEAGYFVYLVEKSPAIGGTMPRLDKTFPTNDCSMCIISPKLIECARHLNIKILTNAEVKEISGEAGNFTVRVSQRRRCVDLEKCTGCGDCAAACPVETTSEFDAGLSKRKAIYRLYPQAAPGAFAIEKRGVPPCRHACPAGVNVQGYVQLTRLGKYKEAWELIYRDNPFPAVCGRVCTAPCQDACHRGQIDAPVQIRELKRFLADQVYRKPEEIILPAIPPRQEQKVAVVGSGPAGLSAAYHLAKKGYPVTVFEALPVAGGMLRTGIPDYRLPKEWVELEIGLIQKLGVEFRFNQALGRDFTLPRLFAEGYRAVFLALGATKENRLHVPGEELTGVMSGIEFLRRVNLGEKPAVGPRVVVIGGGNTAVDAARTALRLGASDVHLVYRRSEQEMPAAREEVQQAREEGVIFHLFASPKAIHGSGKVARVECLRNEPGAPDESGRRKPVPVPGSEFSLAADTVIVAVGQTPDTGHLPLPKNKNNTLAADPETLALEIPGVFAGGDVVTGPASVVAAIGAGKKAAGAIASYLRGEEPAVVRPEEEIAHLRFSPAEVIKIPPARPVYAEPPARRRNFAEICAGLTTAEAAGEAQRCLNCGVCAECGECVRACLPAAIDHAQADTEQEIKVGAVILAPGLTTYDPRELDYYGYGVYPNVITSIELERILSATGPSQGRLVRPSDGAEPKKMAFLQCVGSRNRRIGRDYCSAACCTFAIKEAIIAKEHVPHPLDVTIFFLDMRTYGKDFERYYERAKNEHGVKFVRSRVYAVEETPDAGLKIRFAEESGAIKTEEFDLVVLAVGLGPPAGVRELAAAAGIELNGAGFCAAPDFASVSTTRPGIYAAGVFTGPKDIPETVTEASAAAGCAARLLSTARGELARVKTYPPERDVTGLPPRTGVFVCNCGINIGGVIDLPRVVTFAAGLKHVAHAEEFLFTCAQDSITKIKKVIREKDLNRVVVASCTPRTHAPLFQDALRETGLNPYLYEHVNIREHSSWVHRHNPAAATAKAQQLIKMAVARVARHVPVAPATSEIKKSALVVGGGMAGMTAALSLAEQGFKVFLAEKSNALGGNARHLFYTLSAARPQEILTETIRQVRENPLIEIFLPARVQEAKGYPGNYRTRLQVAGEAVEITHGAVILATGAREYRPAEYLYGVDPRVLTQRELEARLAAGETYQNVVMIQCVGSRQEGRPYCSRVCCQHAVKNALKLKERNPRANIVVLYRDIRTYGLKEEFYTRARQEGVIFLRYEPPARPVVRTDGTRLLVDVHDLILDQKLTFETELVVLSAGIVPGEDNEHLSRLFKLPLTEDGFFLEAHTKLRPVDFAAEGFYLSGLAHAPRLLGETLTQAGAAAMRAAAFLAKDRRENLGSVATVDPELCAGCGMCVLVCDYQARAINPETKKAEVTAALCQGCGACVATCPNGAAGQKGFEKSQLMAMLEAAMAL